MNVEDADQVKLLRQLSTIRQRSYQVFGLAEKDQLEYFEYVPEREKNVVDYCALIVRRDYGQGYISIPGHGRWRHLDAGGIKRVDGLRRKWSEESKLDKTEQTRRLVELFIVAVLLDAGAGPDWKYQEPQSSRIYSRSEGLAVAALHLFSSGLFSSNSSDPHQVDAVALSRLQTSELAKGLQVSESNPIHGLDGRSSVLTSLGKAVQENKHGYFTPPNTTAKEGRLGYLVDYLLSKRAPISNDISIHDLWEALLVGLSDIWPKDRIHLNGESLGDVWRCESLMEVAGKDRKEDGYAPFHKLTQWMTYSVIEPLEVVLGVQITGQDQLTGLPEYRNGGLFIDMGVLKPRQKLVDASSPNPSTPGIPALSPTHAAVVEWRCMTIVLLDRIAAALNKQIPSHQAKLKLAQVLEAATWKGGREIAMTKRPPTGLPPIEIVSDGTIF